jgi:hypothetical protein
MAMRTSEEARANDGRAAREGEIGVRARRCSPVATASLTPYELPEIARSQVSGRIDRSAPAYGLKGATEFTDDRDLMNARWVVRELKRFSALWQPIRDAACREYAGVGRRGFEDGDWAHAFAVFTMSDTPYLTTFWNEHQDSGLWREAGFGDAVPSFQAMEENFRRLLGRLPEKLME